MKIQCLTDLDKFRLSRTKKTYCKMDTKEYYIFEDSCNFCGESYMRDLKSKTNCCSLACAQSGNNNHEYGKSGKLNPWYGHKHTKLAIEKISNRSIGKSNTAWKGGVIKNNLPLYNTYVNQLSFIEECRSYIDKDGLKLLEVRCKKCNEWFVPTRISVRERLIALNAVNSAKENNFYCSEKCKEACPIYWKRKWPEGTSPRKKSEYYTDQELSIWSQEVIKRAGYTCEYCSAKAEHAHHIQPKKLESFYALDPDNGIACCKACHLKHGHTGRCSYVNLANLNCNKQIDRS